MAKLAEIQDEINKLMKDFELASNRDEMVSIQKRLTYLGERKARILEAEDY